MASSMTGVGFGEIQKDGTTLTVELKSVNNRFLEVSFRMPSFLATYETDIKELIRKWIQRGKLYANVIIQGETNGILNIQLDPLMTSAVHRLLEQLQAAVGVQEELRLEHFLKFSEIFQPVPEPERTGKAWEMTQAAFELALADLKRMRDQEGETISTDMYHRIDRLEKELKTIEDISRRNVPETYGRLTERLGKLVKDHTLSEERMITEVSLMADKLDVTEECVRMQSHIQTFRRILSEQAAVGKKLTFLLQEMNRETNTISSKASHAEISRCVVEIKEEIEKLREQVQNLE